VAFVKLDCGILDSTLWVENLETRITFITMLAMARADGLVEATAPGIARRANISLEAVRYAIEKLEQPDEDSRSLSEDGRRVMRVDGGYQIINYLAYRERDLTATERMRRYRAKQKEQSNQRENDPLHRNVITKPLTVTEAEAEAEAEAEKKTTLSGLQPDASPIRKKNGHHYLATARSLLAFLNEKTGRNYKPVDSNLSMIVARLKEGHTERECKLVILRKFHDWGTDEKMAEYLRPATLFNATKFNQYGGEIPKEDGNGV